MFSGKLVIIENLSYIGEEQWLGPLASGTSPTAPMPVRQAAVLAPCTLPHASGIGIRVESTQLCPPLIAMADFLPCRHDQSSAPHCQTSSPALPSRSSQRAQVPAPLQPPPHRPARPFPGKSAEKPEISISGRHDRPSEIGPVEVSSCADCCFGVYSRIPIISVLSLWSVLQRPGRNHVLPHCLQPLVPNLPDETPLLDILAFNQPRPEHQQVEVMLFPLGAFDLVHHRG